MDRNNNNNNDDSDHDNDPQQQQQHTTIPKELSKKFVQAFAPPLSQQEQQTTSTTSTTTTKRVSAETAEAMSEVLRLFVVEAHTRASIEAECDQEGALLGKDSEDDVDEDSSSDHEGVDARTTNSVRKRQKQQKQPRVPIRGEHVTKVAANLIMDFT